MKRIGDNPESDRGAVLATSTGPTAALVGLSLARAAWAVTLLSAPGPALRLLGGRSADERSWRIVARVLGIRHAVQAALQLRSCSQAGGTGTASLVGAGADTLHGLSDLVLAAVAPGRRRLALADAMVAGGCTAVEALTAHGNRRRSGMSPGRPLRWFE